MTQSLEPIVPEEAVDQYLKSRGQDASESTIQNHRYRLKHFLKWCDHVSIENLNELSGRDCENYKNWRIAQGDIADITLEQQLRTFRVFLRYCESIEAIETGISEKLIIPRVEQKANANYERQRTRTWRTAYRTTAATTRFPSRFRSSVPLLNRGYHDKQEAGLLGFDDLHSPMP